MKKCWLVLLLLLTTCTGCGSQTKASDKEFVVGFDASFPPYGYLDEETGEYVGFDLDLAAEVCDRNNWELIKTPINWDAKDMELNSGAIDCIWNGFTMNGREDDYAWSDPYVDNSQVIVVSTDSKITTLAQLANKIVLVQADSSALHALNSDELLSLKDSFSQLIEVPDYNTAFLDLEAGGADAIALDKGVAQFQVNARDGKYVILDESIALEQYAVGFALENTELRDQVQSTIDDMVEDGTFSDIANKWDLADSVCLGK